MLEDKFSYIGPIDTNRFLNYIKIGEDKDYVLRWFAVKYALEEEATRFKPKQTKKEIEAVMSYLSSRLNEGEIKVTILN